MKETHISGHDVDFENNILLIDVKDWEGYIWNYSVPLELVFMDYKSDDFKRHARINEYCCNPRNLFNPLDNEEACEEKIRKFKEFKSRVEQEDPDGFYVEFYHIDTTDGLRAFTNFVKENNIQSKWWDGISEM